MVEIISLLHSLRFVCNEKIEIDKREELLQRQALQQQAICFCILFYFQK